MRARVRRGLHARARTPRSRPRDVGGGVACARAQPPAADCGRPAAAVDPPALRRVRVAAHRSHRRRRGCGTGRDGARRARAARCARDVRAARCLRPRRGRRARHLAARAGPRGRRLCARRVGARCAGARTHVRRRVLRAADARAADDASARAPRDGGRRRAGPAGVPLARRARRRRAPLLSGAGARASDRCGVAVQAQRSAPPPERRRGVAPDERALSGTRVGAALHAPRTCTSSSHSRRATR